MAGLPPTEHVVPPAPEDLERQALADGSAVGALLRLYRVRDWFHFLALPLATFDAQAPRLGALLAVGRGMATTFAILSFGYLLNCVADRRMDLDARKNPLIGPATGHPHRSLALLLALSLILAAISPWPAQIASAVSLLCLYVYSAGPRVKSIPIVGSLVNVGNFAPLLFVGMSDTSLPPNFGPVVWTFSGLLLQNQLIHEAADQVEDRAGQVHTTWLTLGPRWTAALAAASALGACVAATHMLPATGSAALPVIGAVVFGVAFPLLLATRARNMEHASRLRVAHRWCAVLFGTALFIAWH